MRRLCWLLLAACGNAEPPFAELPLRDTLLADPRMIAAMPEDQRALLRERFTAALNAPAAGDTKLAADRTDARVSEHDVLREQAGRDADLIVRLKPSGLASRGKGLPRELPPHAQGSLVFEQDLAPIHADTLPLETRALAGRAGALVRELQTTEQARRVVRVVGWPAAVTKEGDALYVNASWLVAMAGEDEALSVTVTQQSFGLTVETVTDVNACSTQVANMCEACRADRAQCSGEPLLTDYGSAAAECDAVAGNADLSRFICRAAGLQRGDVRQCLERNEPQCMGAFTTAAFWRAFDSKAICVKTMDRCLLDPAYNHKISCDACKTSCQTGGCSTPSCNRSGCSGSTCNQPSCNCGSSKVCAQAQPEMQWDSFAGVPWALLPLVVFWRLGRRRQERV